MAKINVNTVGTGLNGKPAYTSTFNSTGVDIILCDALKAITVYARIAADMNWVKVAAIKAKDTITQLELVEGMQVYLESPAEFNYQLL